MQQLQRTSSKLALGHGRGAKVRKVVVRAAAAGRAAAVVEQRQRRGRALAAEAARGERALRVQAPEPRDAAPLVREELRV
jgi:hypothetical protein